MALLVPQPLLSIAYLLGVRARWFPPSLVVVGVLAVFPVAAVILALGRGRPRPSVVVAAVLELAWTGVSAALVGFAVAWRAG